MSGNQVAIEYLTDRDALNTKAREVMLRAIDRRSEIIMSTVEGRWLGIIKGETPPGDKHIELNERLCEMSAGVDCVHPELNAKVLLVESPAKKKDLWQLERLIGAGADVRFSEADDRTRILLSSNELVVAFTTYGKSNAIVDTGFYYKSELKNDGILRYIRDRFVRGFEGATEVVAVENGQPKIYQAGTVEGVANAWSSLGWREAILIAIGFLVSTLGRIVVGGFSITGAG